MASKNKRKTRSSFDWVLGLVCIVLMFLLLVTYLKGKADIARMEQQIDAAKQAVEEQRLVNKDLEFSLRQDEMFLERTARDKLNYAYPEERVFIDSSGG